jgi:hypothetical protein
MRPLIVAEPMLRLPELNQRNTLSSAWETVAQKTTQQVNKLQEDIMIKELLAAAGE